MVVAFGLAAATLLAGCATAPAVVPAAPALVWPAPPDEARVAWLHNITQATDLGISKGLLQRVGELLFGAEDLRLVRPMALVDVDGLLYVADPGVRGLHRFDRAGGRHQILRGDKGAPLPSPVGLARGAAGAVYLTDSALRKVYLVAPGAAAVAELPLQAELRQPTGVAYDAERQNLYVADTAAHCVHVFERDGRLAATLGERGAGEGQFNYPTHLWRDAAGRLYVTDALNFRVQVFDAAGRFVSAFGRHGDGSGDMARHKGVATDSQGHIYVVDSLLHALQIFDASGRFLLGLGGQGREPGEFWLPAGIFIGGDDTIYVADAYNGRVQVLRYIGADQ